MEQLQAVEAMALECRASAGAVALWMTSCRDAKSHVDVRLDCHAVGVVRDLFCGRKSALTRAIMLDYKFVSAPPGRSRYHTAGPAAAFQRASRYRTRIGRVPAVLARHHSA